MSKYRNKPVTIDGIRFDSKREANRYCELKLLHQAGEIHKLRTHPRYTLLEPFEVNGVKYRGINYTADFEYVENGQLITEDVKGGKATKTEAFVMRMKLFIKRYGDTHEFRIT